MYGKSGLKAIQFMALGIPVIASSIGTNFRVIDHGVNGYLAKNKNAVVEGRDIGTNVFPEADFKFYLSAKLEVRADRRYREMIKSRKTDISKQEVLKKR